MYHVHNSIASQSHAVAGAQIFYSSNVSQVQAVAAASVSRSSTSQADISSQGQAVAAATLSSSSMSHPGISSQGQAVAAATVSHHRASHVTCFCANVRSLTKKYCEVAYFIDLHTPDVLVFQETWLTPSTEEFKIANYKKVSRLDRRDGRQGGDVCVYCKSHLDCLVEVCHSEIAERSWMYLYSDHGIILIGNCYRHPAADDICMHHVAARGTKPASAACQRYCFDG